MTDSIFLDVRLPGQITCRRVDLNRITEHETALTALLDVTERARAKALLLDDDRKNFIRTHGWMRIILGDETGQSPESLVFTRNAHGKPALDLPDAPHFSLSASGNQAVLAISGHKTVGTDIEQLLPISDTTMLPMVGHASDNIILELPEPERLVAFYRLWTGKEAILKAIGTGFQNNPRQIELGEDYLLGNTSAKRITAFDQDFDLYSELTGGSMIALAISTQPT